MASPMRPNNRSKRNTAEGAARSKFVLNPEYGYFSSQVQDREAFRQYLPAQAGEETQAELQEPWQNTAAAPAESKVDAPEADIKPIIVKIEKENVWPNAVASRLASVPKPSSAKRARVDDPIVKAQELDIPALAEQPETDRLRVCQLENEVSDLRRQIAAIQEDAAHTIDALRSEWELMRSECVFFQSRVGGFGVRLSRVEGHVDEIVEHLPGHHGWRSEVGSNYDPDRTLTDIDIEDGTQPLEAWTEEQDWSDSEVDVKKEQVDV